MLFALGCFAIRLGGNNPATSMKLLSATGLALAIPLLLSAIPLSADDAPPRWEITAGTGLTDVKSRFNFFHIRPRSYHVTAGVRPLNWLGVELGYMRVAEGVDSSFDLPPERWSFAAMPHITRLKSEAVRLGPAFVWSPTSRLELSAKAMASYRVESSFTYGGFVFPSPEWIKTRTVRFTPTVGAKFSLTRRYWIGIEYGTERHKTWDMRTWQAHLAVRW